MATPPQNLLLVEDDVDIAHSMTDVLSEAGYAVRWEADGSAGLDALLGGYQPALIVLDLMMPRMDGVEFLRQVREKNLAEAVPVLVTSAFPTAPEFADAYLRKPFSLEELLQAIRALPRAGG